MSLNQIYLLILEQKHNDIPTKQCLNEIIDLLVKKNIMFEIKD